MARTKQTARKCTGGMKLQRRSLRGKGNRRVPAAGGVVKKGDGKGAKGLKRPAGAGDGHQGHAPVAPIAVGRRRYLVKRGTKALREIRAYQKGTQLLVPRAPFSRLVREIASRLSPDFRFTRTALEALQEAAEAYIVGVMEDTQFCAVHGKRVTIFAKDMQLAARLRRPS